MPRKITGLGLLLPALLAITAAPLQAQNNSWTNGLPGNWGDAANWSFGAPAVGEDLYITNVPGKTVSIDGTVPTNTLTVSSVTIGSPGPAANGLSLLGSPAGPLHITGKLLLREGGALDVNSTNGLQVDGTTIIAAASGVSSTLGATTFTVSNSGLASFGDLTVGETNSSAVLNLSGGTIRVLGELTVASEPFSTGIVNMTAGHLFHTNSALGVGWYGTGTFVQSGGTNTTRAVILGNGAGSRGLFTLAGGVLTCAEGVRLGNNYGAGPCDFHVNTNGSLYVTNAAHTAYVDVSLTGSLTLNGGLLQVDNLVLTNGGTFTNISGTLSYTGPFLVDNGSSVNLMGGTVVAATNFSVGSTAGANSSVSVAGGSLFVTNAPLLIGPVSVGSMTISSGGGVTAQTIKLGSSTPGATGSLVMNGGSLRVTGLLSVSSTSSFDLPGINVVVDGTGATLNVGDDNPGKVSLSSPSASQNWANMNIGYNATGTYLQSAGQTVVTQSVMVGNCVTNGPGAAGLVTLSGGAFYVTNSTHTAVLVVRSGTFVLGSGATLVVDNLIITNACAQFQNDGGTLSYGQLTLNPNLDTDGDGVSNSAEALAGTDPLNPSSNFRTLGVTVSGQDVIVSWSSVDGHGYVVQASNTGLASGSFADISPPISATSTGTTNYRVVGGANHHAGFYRVRLSP